MKTFACLLLLIVPLVHAQRITITDVDSGKIHGPVELGDKLKLDGKSYVVQTATDPETKLLEQRLKKWMIPRLQFESVSLNDAVGFLHQTCRQLGRDVSQSVNIVTHGSIDRFGSTPFDLNLVNISVYEALDEVCRKADCVFRLEGNVVTIKRGHRIERADLEKRLAVLRIFKERRIPELALEDASLNDTIEFLMQTLREQGAQFNILSIQVPERSIEDDIFDDFGDFGDDFGEPLAKPAGPLITLHLRNVSIFEALNLICLKADMEWIIGKDAVIITNKD